jgi:GntR family transcriptional regulator/MocR family aminotransferase
VFSPSVYKAPGQQAFQLGQPAIDAFPHAIWHRLLSRRYRCSWQELFGYQDAFGYPPLRAAIAAYLGVARGVQCSPDQVIITAGSQQGLDLLARTLLQPDDAVWMEDPGYGGARWAFQRAGLRVVPVPLDHAGLDVSAAQNLAPDARLAFVTPSHQFPLGMTMSLERRLALLAWATDRQSWIVEDDCNSEYRYAGRPLPALQGLDTSGRVLYLGTFSNILFPALRLGYLVVPSALVDTLMTARRVVDLHAPALEQAVVADFIVQGHFVRHIRRMRTLYTHRQTVLRTAIGRYLPGILEVHPDPAGMHLVAWLPPQLAESEPIVQAAHAIGLELLPLSWFSVGPLRRQGLVLGYAAIDDDQIIEGVRTLSRVVERTLKDSRQNVLRDA